jgi:hypothetical protein
MRFESIWSIMCTLYKTMGVVSPVVSFAKNVRVPGIAVAMVLPLAKAISVTAGGPLGRKHGAR